MDVGIVTGAGSGMGAACATLLAERLDAVVVVDRSAAALEAVAVRLAGGRAVIEPVVLDITDRAGLDAMARTAAGLGDVVAVAHAAGVSPTMAGWRDVIEIDLVATAALVDAVTPVLAGSAAVVCFASIAPHLAFDRVDPAIDHELDDPLGPGLADRLLRLVGPDLEQPGLAYSWAKRGVQRLVARRAVPLGARGARICSVSPGIIDTPMGRQEDAAHSVNSMLVERTPLGREGDAAEVAAVVDFLLSPAASFVTGIDIPVDGGVVAALGPAGHPLADSQG